MWSLMKLIIKAFKSQRTAQKRMSKTSIWRSWTVVQKKKPVDSLKQPIEIVQQSELPNEWRIPKDLSVENIIGQIKEGVSTRSSISNFC